MPTRQSHNMLSRKYPPHAFLQEKRHLVHTITFNHSNREIERVFQSTRRLCYSNHNHFTGAVHYTIKSEYMATT